MNVMKLSNNVSIRKQISVDLSANQWDLYTHSYSRTVIEKVANILNRRLVLAFNSGKRKEEVQSEMLALMDDFSVYGASDTEPRAVLNKLLNSLYSV
jgi:hypothetical protein